MPKALVRSSDVDLLNNFWNEPVHRTVLPNGLTLVMKPDHSAQLASVQVWVKTGSVHEGQWLGAGISHFLEHMLFKGTERRAGREISAEVQANGGYINAYTTFDRTVYYIDLPSENLAVAMDILSDAVFHSRLPEDEFAKERDVILREIAMTKDDPDQRLGEALFDTAFKEHPYRHPVIGHRPLFEGLTHADLVAYYKTRYVPNNMVLVVVGAVDQAAVLELAGKHFGGVPRARLPQGWIPPEPEQLSPRIVHGYEDVEVTRVNMSWHVPGFSHPDSAALDMLAVILGCGDSSVLWQRLREKARLVHTIDAQNWSPGDSGLFYVSINCDADKRDKALAALQAELARFMRTGPAAADMRKAVRQLVVGEINTRKTMSGQAGRLGAAEVTAGDLDFSKAYFDRVRRLTAADLKRVASRYLQPSRQTVVTSNPLASKPVAPEESKASGSNADFELVTLPNGARILWQEDSRLPNVHMRLACQGGPAVEPEGKAGVCNLMATLLAKDTRKRDAEQVARRIEEVGGSFSPFSGINSLGLAGEVLSTDVDRLVATFAEAVREPAFLAKTLSLERDAVLADLKQEADDIVSQGRKLMRSRFFAGNPLARDARGDAAGVASVTVADVKALHARLLVGSNVVLSVSGDFKARTLLPKLKAWLGKLPKGKAPEKAPAHTPAPAVDHAERMEREQAVVFQAYGGPGVLGEDFHVAEVADELFSGMASRLFERVREEKGLAYFVRSSRVLGLSSGMFFFYAGTAPDKAQEVLAEIEAEVSRVAGGGVEPEEIARCVARLKAGRRAGLQTIGARCLNAALNELFGLPLNEWRNYDARISVVDSAALARFASTRLRSEHRLRLVIGPKA